MSKGAHARYLERMKRRNNYQGSTYTHLYENAAAIAFGGGSYSSPTANDHSGPANDVKMKVGSAYAFYTKDDPNYYKTVFVRHTLSGPKSFVSNAVYGTIPDGFTEVSPEAVLKFTRDSNAQFMNGNKYPNDSVKSEYDKWSNQTNNYDALKSTGIEESTKVDGDDVEAEIGDAVSDSKEVMKDVASSKDALEKALDKKNDAIRKRRADEMEKQLQNLSSNRVDEAKLDPVSDEDADVNNDGKVNDTDEYLSARRRVISKKIQTDKSKGEVPDKVDEELSVSDQMKVSQQYFKDRAARSPQEKEAEKVRDAKARAKNYASHKKPDPYKPRAGESD